MKIEKLFPVETKIVICQGKMLEVISEEIFQMLIIISVVACYVVENFMVISPDFFPLDFFPRDFFARNLGENLFLIKLKIWERNFVFPLILANEVFEMFQSGICFWPGCGESFANKFRSTNFFFGVGIGIGHFLSGESFGGGVCEMCPSLGPKAPFARAVKLGEKKMRMAFFKTFSCADFSVVVVNKTFLGHSKKSSTIPRFPTKISPNFQQTPHPTDSFVKFTTGPNESDGFDVFLRNPICVNFGGT